MRTNAFDPITLEVLRNRLDAIAQEMQDALVRSAYSNIIKEGHDCSAALFDAQRRSRGAGDGACRRSSACCRRRSSAWCRCSADSSRTATSWP